MKRHRAMSRMLLILTLLLLVYVIFGDNADAATFKRCGSGNGVTHIEQRDFSCTFARRLAREWYGISEGLDPVRLRGFDCLSTAHFNYIAVRCYGIHETRLLIRWRVPEQGEF